MDDAFTRREVIGAGALALTLTAGIAKSAPAGSVPIRSRQRLERWRFHIGHASNVDLDFGFGRNQRTFAKAGVSADAAMPDFDDKAWAKVQVPHDWAVTLPFAEPAVPPSKETADAAAAHGFKAIGRDHPANSIGWYRHPIQVTEADRGRRIWLEFDGVFRDAIVFVNGYVVGRNESGYAPFRVEIDDFLNYDGKPNLIAVRVDATLVLRGRGHLPPRRPGARGPGPHPAMGNLRPQRSAHQRSVASSCDRCAQQQSDGCVGGTYLIDLWA